MIGILSSLAVAGGLIGLRFRAAALIPASLAVVVWSVVVRHPGFLPAVTALVALHSGYLAGLAVRTFLDRR